MTIMEEKEVEYWKDMENTEENWEKIIWKRWKKSKLNNEMIWKMGKKSTCKLNSVKIWKICKKGKLNNEKIWKIQKKIVKRYGNYERKIIWIVKRFGKYRRQLWNDMENKDAMWNDMENMEEK